MVKESKGRNRDRVSTGLSRDLLVFEGSNTSESSSFVDFETYYPYYQYIFVVVIHANLSSVCLLELLEFPQGMEVSEGITIGEGLAAKWLTQTLADAVMGKSFRLGKMAL